jgi:hypothetical protein
MVLKLNDDMRDGEFLHQYRTAILSLLRRAGFRNCAEDVASDMVVGQLAKMREGSSFRPRGMTLPEVLKREAFRKAKRATSLKPIGEAELNEIRSADGMEDEVRIYCLLMPVLEDAFDASQIGGMIGAVASGKDRLRDLAEAAGISERTFRTRLRDMGVAPRR